MGTYTPACAFLYAHTATHTRIILSSFNPRAPSPLGWYNLVQLCCLQSHTDLHPRRLQLLVYLLTEWQKVVKVTHRSWGKFGVTKPLTIASWDPLMVQPQTKHLDSALKPFQHWQLIRCCRINFHLPPVCWWWLIAFTEWISSPLKVHQ